MPHIHTEPGQHDSTISAYIVRTDVANPALLLHKHKKLKKYLQFGGHIELNENPWEAISHEVAEESGYSVEQLQVLQPDIRLTKLSDATLHPYPISYQTHRFGELHHYHTDIAYAFLTNEPPHSSVSKGESADIQMFTAEELRAIPAGEIPENVRETGLFVLQNCLGEWQPINVSEWAK